MIGLRRKQIGAVYTLMILWVLKDYIISTFILQLMLWYKKTMYIYTSIIRIRIGDIIWIYIQNDVGYNALMRSTFNCYSKKNIKYGKNDDRAKSKKKLINAWKDYRKWN